MSEDTTRRDFLLLTAAAVAPTRVAERAAAQGADHVHQAVPSDPALRTKALESLLVEKGIVDPEALDALVDTYEHKVGPRNGARVIARAWVDPAYNTATDDQCAGGDRRTGLRVGRATTWSPSKTRRRP